MYDERGEEEVEEEGVSACVVCVQAGAEYRHIKPPL